MARYFLTQSTLPTTAGEMYQQDATPLALSASQIADVLKSFQDADPTLQTVGYDSDTGSWFAYTASGVVPA